MDDATHDNRYSCDGVLTSLKLMEVMVERKSSMSELTRGLKIYPQLLNNLRVTSKPEVAADQDVQAVKKEIEAQLGEDGRILLRESETEPVIRVMVEAESDELCEKYVNQMVQVIDSKGYIL